ncbi:MAG TPA: hypothetical protein VKT28_05350 [Puia sp.]|nr:hypothetical protein [Puia sp.]
MKPILTAFLILLSSNIFSQTRDTINVTAKDLNMSFVPSGHISYLVFNRKPKDHAAEKLVKVNINVRKDIYQNKNSFIVDQIWEADTIVHSAHTVLNADDASTLLHTSFWKRLGYSATYDFINRKISYDKTLPDSVVQKNESDFKRSFADFRLNWHSDLIVFTMLPYKAGRSFRMPFYDPGFGEPATEIYSVIGNEVLTEHDGKPTDCWILNLDFTSQPGAYQRFWIAKSNQQIVKEEDYYMGGYRYKLLFALKE